MPIPLRDASDLRDGEVEFDTDELDGAVVSQLPFDHEDVPREINTR